jgi:hypothetical protein
MMAIRGAGSQTCVGPMNFWKNWKLKKEGNYQILFPKLQHILNIFLVL